MKEYCVQESELEAKTISFLGVEPFDFILFLARILSNLKKRVLVIDISDRAALTDGLYDTSDAQVAIIEPCILNLKGIDFIPKLEEWTYRGDFYNQFLYHTNCDYDYILVDYGFNIAHTAISKSTLVILISDMQKHNINSMRPIMEQFELPKALIIKDIVPSKIKAKDLFSDCMQGNQNMIFQLDLDVNDLSNKIQMQHTRSINLRKCSKRMKNLLCGVVSLIEKDRTKKEVFEALSVTWRGK